MENTIKSLDPQIESLYNMLSSLNSLEGKHLVIEIKKTTRFINDLTLTEQVFDKPVDILDKLFGLMNTINVNKRKLYRNLLNALFKTFSNVQTLIFGKEILCEFIFEDTMIKSNNSVLNFDYLYSYTKGFELISNVSLKTFVKLYHYIYFLLMS